MSEEFATVIAIKPGANHDELVTTQ